MEGIDHVAPWRENIRKFYVLEKEDSLLCQLKIVLYILNENEQIHCSDMVHKSLCIFTVYLLIYSLIKKDSLATSREDS